MNFGKWSGSEGNCDRYSGQSVAAVLLKICSRISALIGSALNSSRFRLTSGNAGLGQSVPNSVLWAISLRRGKYFSRAFGGMPLMSR